MILVGHSAYFPEFENHSVVESNYFHVSEDN